MVTLTRQRRQPLLQPELASAADRRDTARAMHKVPAEATVGADHSAGKGGCSPSARLGSIR
jgi:hypothetical protein